MTKERIGFIGLGIMGKRMALEPAQGGIMTIRSGSEETRRSSPPGASGWWTHPPGWPPKAT